VPLGSRYPIEDEDEDEDDYDQPFCTSSFSSGINSLSVEQNKNAGRPKPPCIQSYMPT
jgi:hypothetical protein